ncbi:MAG: hypothetical protein H0T84_03950 [Tatlockia sp.]|nr:hypothetical protein [Tatlockia sp.]
MIKLAFKNQSGIQMKKKIESTQHSLYEIKDPNQLVIGFLYETFQDHDESLEERVLFYLDKSSHLFLDLSVKNMDDFLCKRAVLLEKDIKNLESKLKVDEELEWIKANSAIVYKFSQVVLKYNQLLIVANEIKDLNDIIAMVSVFTELSPNLIYIIENQQKLSNELKEKLFNIIDNLALLMANFNLKLGQYLQIKLLAQIQSDNHALPLADESLEKNIAEEEMPSRAKKNQERAAFIAETIN